MRLIDADALLEELEDWYKSCGGTTNQRDWIIQDVLSHVIDDVNDAEPVDAEPVRHGEWVKGKWATYPDGYVCNKCNTGFAIPYSYCPSCGAKMDGGKQDANV